MRCLIMELFPLIEKSQHERCFFKRPNLTGNEMCPDFPNVEYADDDFVVSDNNIIYYGKISDIIPMSQEVVALQEC